MLVTEEEAWTKIWCPYSLNFPRQHCMASSCMAWRWLEKSKTTLDPERSTPYVLCHKKTPKKEWKGYCGLAGKPEGV